MGHEGKVVKHHVIQSKDRSLEAFWGERRKDYGQSCAPVLLNTGCANVVDSTILVYEVALCYL